MSNYVKPQNPLYNETNDTFIYPLTTVDQIITNDGKRLNADYVNIDLNNANKSDNMIFADKLPKAGFIYPLASEVVPEGFLLCDGAEYLRDEYPELFAAIGTMYGEGDGSTTFNVPDLCKRVPIGAGENYALGDVGGEETHTLTINEMPSHTHDQIAYQINEGTYDATEARITYKDHATTTWVAEGVSWVNTIGGSQPHNNMQPYTVVNYIIATGKNTGVNVQDIITGAQALPLGVEYGGTGATNAKTARNNLGITPGNIGALSMELLWENGSPSSAFVSQTINAELSGYEFYIVVFRESATIGFYHAQIVPKEKNTLLFTIDGNMATHVARIVTIRDGKIAFNAGFLGTAQNDSYVIPLEIYGIKGVTA